MTAAVTSIWAPKLMRRCHLELPGMTYGHWVHPWATPYQAVPHLSSCLTPLTLHICGAGVLSGWHCAFHVLLGFLSPTLQMILPEADAPGVVLASMPSWRIIGIATGLCLKQAGSSVSSVSTTAYMIPGMTIPF